MKERIYFNDRVNSIDTGRKPSPELYIPQERKPKKLNTQSDLTLMYQINANLRNAKGIQISIAGARAILDKETDSIIVICEDIYDRDNVLQYLKTIYEETLNIVKDKEDGSQLILTRKPNSSYSSQLLDESLYDLRKDPNLFDKIYKVASQVREEMESKYGEDFLHGKCIEASDKIVSLLKDKNVNAHTVEGWVTYDYDECCSDRNYDEHTWVETEEDYIVDVTATQFNYFMEKDYPPIIITKKLPYGFSLQRPNNIISEDFSDKYDFARHYQKHVSQQTFDMDYKDNQMDFISPRIYEDRAIELMNSKAGPSNSNEDEIIGFMVSEDRALKYNRRYNTIVIYNINTNDVVTYYKTNYKKYLFKLEKDYKGELPENKDEIINADSNIEDVILEENLTEDLNSMLPYYKNLQNEDRSYVLSFLSKDPTWNENRESGQYSKWILDKLNRKIIDKSVLGHLGDLLKRFEDNKKQLKDKDINKFKTPEDLESYLNDDNNYTNLSHRQEVRQRQKDRRNVDLGKDAELVYEDNDWEVWIPKTYAASCKLGQGTRWCTASTETSEYYDDYTSDGYLYININKHNIDEKYQFHFESDSYMDKDDEEIDIEEFFINNLTLYKKFYSNQYKFDIDDATRRLSELKKNNYTYYYDGHKIDTYIRNKIKRLIIEDNVTNIGTEAFSHYDSLTSVTIGNSVTSIGDRAFSGCSKLTSIIIGNGVTSIGSSVFSYCDSLNYNVKDNLKYLGNSENPYLYLAGTTSDSITTATIATIDNNCKLIGNYVFSDCYWLTSIIIPDSVTSIGSYAFNRCSSLTSIEIPNSVTNIGYYAFSGCDSLTIYCEAESQPSGWDSDWNYSDCPVVWGYKNNNINESFQKSMNTKYKLEEAKKSKKKRKSQTQNNPVFKDINDIMKWVKKRQKGLSPFSYLNPNAGNVEYNNDMFNHLTGADGGDFGSISGSGNELGAPAIGSDMGSFGGDAGVSAGGGMGESFKIEKVKNNSTQEEMSPNVKLFIEENIDLIEDENWDELFELAQNNPKHPLHLNDEEIDELIYILVNTLGANFEIIE